jgi:hypothetical protein
VASVSPSGAGVYHRRRQVSGVRRSHPSCLLYSGSCRLAHQTVIPPSTWRLMPVTYAEASDARKTRGPTRSLASAIRRNGILSHSFRMNSSSWPPSTPPGEIAFTLMPYGPQNAARYFVRLRTAAFEAP